MRRIRFVGCFILTFALLPQVFCALPKTRVLFIGNNLTSMNNLPQIVADLAKSRGFAMEFDAYAPDGYSLEEHCADGGVFAKMKQVQWDYVVLQEKGILMGLTQDVVDNRVKPYVKEICRAARESNPNVKIVFYAIPIGKNVPKEIQTVVNDHYEALARENQGLVAAVGKAWTESLERLPGVELYAGGENPNVNGSYLIACVFYSLIFKQTAMGLVRDPRIDASTAASLQAIADKTMAFSY